MYNYSPTKIHKGDMAAKAQAASIGSLDNLPAVPDRHSSSSLFDSVVGDTGPKKVFNLYDKIDNLSLNIDKDCEDYSSSQVDAGGDGRKDQFLSQMDEIEQTMRSISLPRFKLPTRPMKLNENSDVFADIDRDTSVRLELFLPQLSRGDVLCLDVVCVPSDMRDLDLIDVCEGSYNKPVDHEPLDVTLAPSQYSEGEAPGAPQAKPHAPFVPVYHNGEYEFNLTSAHGLSAGKYLLTLHNKGRYTQPVRCKMKMRSYVQAVTITAGEEVITRDIPQGEMRFYRFVLPDRDRNSSLVTVRLVPLLSAAGTASDPDLHISNKYAGLVAVDRDNYIWRSTNIGLDQVDIHPNDLNAQRSGIFIIGVLGYNDLNSFSLRVNISSPVRPIDLIPGCISDLVVRTDRYTFYRFPVDNTKKGRLAVTVAPGDSHTGNGKGGVTERNMVGMAASGLESQYGRGVYASDGLVSAGVFAAAFSDQDQQTAAAAVAGGGGAKGTIDRAIAEQLAQSPMRSTLYGGGGGDSTHSGVEISYRLKALMDSLPDTAAKEAGVYPVIHLSSSCLYPTAEAHTWRASSIHGTASAMLECDEWLHTSAQYCYLSVIGVALPSTAQQVQGQMQTPSNPATPDRKNLSGRESPGKYNSPILSTLGAAPLGSASGRFARSQHTVKEVQVRSGSSDEAQEQEQRQGLSASVACKISLEYMADYSDLSSTMQAKYKVFNDVFVDVDGSAISQKDRLASGDLDTPSFTYGEIEYPSFVRLLEDVGARDGMVFADLGCGTGRALVAAALSEIKFLRCIGVELLPGLCMASRQAIERCQTASPASSSLPMMEVWESDVTAQGAEGWSQADVIFASSICFSDSLLQSITLAAAKGLSRGGLLVTLKLPEEENYVSHFKLEKQLWVKMSWGRALVYVLRRF